MNEIPLESLAEAFYWLTIGTPQEENLRTTHDAVRHKLLNKINNLIEEYD